MVRSTSCTSCLHIYPVASFSPCFGDCVVDHLLSPVVIFGIAPCETPAIHLLLSHFSLQPYSTCSTTQASPVPLLRRPQSPKCQILRTTAVSLRLENPSRRTSSPFRVATTPFEGSARRAACQSPQNCSSSSISLQRPGSRENCGPLSATRPHCECSVRVTRSRRACWF